MSEQPEVPDKLNQDSSLAEPLDEAAKLKSNVQSTGDLPAPENNSVLGKHLCALDWSTFATRLILDVYPNPVCYILV